MPIAAARPIAPTATERHRLRKAAWRQRTEHRLRVREQIVLHAARGLPNVRVAGRGTGRAGHRWVCAGLDRVPLAAGAQVEMILHLRNRLPGDP
ncbi:hypothetical protein AB0D14_35635 [Streptomyces sp. NPDC048484]|uniref:hypothetical protein n=1 Tax=Streptomyces sp. NPDC048484 TaxID=3155146 RepID=UPI0034485DC6